jgi:hypothetical protein
MEQERSRAVACTGLVELSRCAANNKTPAVKLEIY